MRKSALPHYLRIAGELRSAIALGNYKSGSQLPTEHALAELFGVCRATVREGLKELQSEGLIERRQGAGTIVKANPAILTDRPQSLASITDLLEYSKRSEVVYSMQSPKPLPPGLALRTGQAVDTEWFHLTGSRYDISTRRAVGVSRVYISPLLADEFNSINLLNSPLFLQIERLTGRKIETVRQDISSLEADEETSKRLRLSGPRSLLRILRFYQTRDGQTLQISVTDYLSDHFTYTSNIEMTN